MMRIVGSFVLRCQRAAASGGIGLALPLLSSPLFGGKKYYFIHPVSFHSSGHCSVAKTRGSISTKILINGEGDVNEQNDVRSRGRSGAEIKTRRADRGAENIPIAPC